MKNDILHFNCFYNVYIISITVYKYVMNFINPHKALNNLFGIVGKKEFHSNEINRQKKTCSITLG